MDRASIDDMARLMRLMNGETDLPQTTGRISAPHTSSAPKGDPEVEAMKVILERLNQASGEVVERLYEEAEHDHELGEALATDTTEHGARIGGWEIRVNEVGIGDRRYDVVNAVTKEPIAKDLFLYEAAYGLVKHLNQGVTINDRRVRHLLRIEEEFVRNRTDAASHKRRRDRLNDQGDEVGAAIAEDRFDESKRRAIIARDRLQHLAGIR